MNHGFSNSQVLARAWKLLKSEYKFLLPAVAISGIILGLMQWLTVATDQMMVVSFLVTVLSIVVSLALTIGWTNVIIRLIRGNSQTWNDFKTKPKIWGKVFLVQLLIAAPTLLAIGLILLIAFLIKGMIPLLVGIVFVLALAVYIQIRFVFLNPVAIDYSEMKIIALFKKTAAVTKNHFFDLLGFGILMVLVNIGGLLLLGIGLFITIPVTMIAKLFVYEKITEKTASAE